MERFKINYHYESKEQKYMIVLDRTEKMVYLLVNDEVHVAKLRDSGTSEFITMNLKNGNNSKKITWFANAKWR